MTPTIETKHLLPWRNAHTDAHRGVAFFDGVLIETDSIADPRPDRVLPILIEEQVLMSRLFVPRLESIRNHLGRRVRVLDVGTGSGVFAVVAAKAGCEVVALDRSARACDFARHNAMINRVPISTTSEGGWIDVRRAVFDEDLRPETLGPAFDIVLLSPPYNPTYPEIARDVAVHAAAGEIGHDEFESQMLLVPRFVGDRGWCIGNHMTAGTEKTPSHDWTRRFEQTLAHATIREAWKDTSIDISVVPICPTTFATEDFLKQQYRNLAVTRPGTVQWVVDTAERFPWLAYIYFEIAVPGDGRMEVIPIPTDGERPCHGADWSDRIDLHRRIVENTSPAGVERLPALVLQASAPNIARVSHSAGDKDKTEAKALGNLHNYMLGEFERLRHLFSVVLVDTAPIYPSIGAPTQLNQSLGVWTFDRRLDSETAREDFIKAWQGNTARLQKAKCGPFAHPAFAGIVAERGAVAGKDLSWPEAIWTRFDEDPLGKLQLTSDEGKQASVFKRSYKVVRRHVEATSSDAANYAFSDNSDQPKDEHVSFRTETLSRLNVESFFENEGNLNERVAEAVASDVEREPMAVGENSRTDLRACHTVMHELENETFEPIFNRCGVGMPATWLLAIPLGLAFEPNMRAEDAWPRHYWGGTWLFCVPTADADLVAVEERIRRIASLAWLEAVASYSVRRAELLERIAFDSGQGEALHRIPTAFSGAIEKLLQHQKDCRTFRVPPMLYTAALECSLKTGHRADFRKFVPRLGDYEETLRSGGLTKQLVGDLVETIARPMAKARLASQLSLSVLSRLQCDVSVAGHVAVENVTFEGEDEIEAAVFLGILVVLLQEAIQHTMRLSAGSERAATEVTVRMTDDAIIEISNPLNSPFDQEQYRRGTQKRELELLAAHVRGWRLEDPDVTAGHTLVRRLKRVPEDR